MLPPVRLFVVAFGMLCLGLSAPQAEAFKWSSLYKVNPTAQHEAVKVGSTEPWFSTTHPQFEAQATLLLNTEDSFPTAQWWAQWADPDLQTLIALLLEQNLTLEQARLQVAEAEAVRKQVRSNEFPLLTTGPSYNRQKNSQNLISPSQEQLNGASNGGANVFSPGNTFSIYNLPLNASYELDLFFKNRMRTQGQGYLAKAQAVAFKSVVTSQLTTLCSTYVNWRLAQVAQQLDKANIEALTTQVTLNQQRTQSGLANALPLQQAQGSLKVAEQSLLAHQQQAAVFAHSMAVLTGQTPAAFANIVAGLQLPQVATPTYASGLVSSLPAPQQGLPAGLVTRRPDIVEQELRLLAAQADLSVARRAFLPDITLTGSAGLVSTSLANWLRGDSFAWSLGAGLVQTIFNGGQRFYAVDEKKAAYERLLSAYRQQLLVSFQEVEQALTELDGQQHQLGRLASQQALLASQLALNEQRYHSGLSSYLPVAEAQIALNNQHLKQEEASSAVLQARLSLVKALGGGW